MSDETRKLLELIEDCSPVHLQACVQFPVFLKHVNPDKAIRGAVQKLFKLGLIERLDRGVYAGTER